MSVPAEWAAHRALWLGFPSHRDLWLDNLAAAQEEVAQLAAALTGAGRERVKLLACGEEALRAAANLTGAIEGVEIIAAVFGDIWLRDTGPIFNGPGRAAAFAFNGWGGKYRLPGDEAVASEIAGLAGATLERHAFVLEGGAVDHDGEGTTLTTRQCLLNPNRNPGWRQADAEAALERALGVSKVIWLDDGLARDHTDGHVDNLARFIAPGVVACAAPSGADDPNRRVYDAAAALLGGAADARGRRLRVVEVPSPGRIDDAQGVPVAASHMNFLIANGAVIVPGYGEEAAAAAVEALAPQFPSRRVVALPSRALISGGGSFHCISQQEPA